jgi:hypothetical protein
MIVRAARPGRRNRDPDREQPLRMHDPTTAVYADLSEAFGHGLRRGS